MQLCMHISPFANECSVWWEMKVVLLIYWILVEKVLKCSLSINAKYFPIIMFLLSLSLHRLFCALICSGTRVFFEKENIQRQHKVSYDWGQNNMYFLVLGFKAKDVKLSSQPWQADEYLITSIATIEWLIIYLYVYAAQSLF